MEAITYLAALSMAMSGGSGKGGASAALIGTWRVQLSQEVRDVAKKMGMPEPQAQFVFNADNTFVYSANNGGATRSFNGTWDARDHDVKLLALNSNGAWPSPGMVGQFKNKQLEVNGLDYAKSDDSGVVAGVSSTSVAGTWVLSGDESVKMVFKADGSFEFAGQMATSKGKYAIDGDQLTLNWTEIDGEKVAAGSVHKTVSIAGGVLQIDTYQYHRK